MSAIDLAALASADQQEVQRQMGVCNACRYCEGLCAVFPAMELRRTFTAGDVDYLSNLCHNCGACYYDCQYAPPHPFAINVPVAMANLREETYARYVWPSALAPVFERNGLWVAIASAVGVAAFIGGAMLLNDPGVFFGVHVGEGAFYRIMPHNVMVALFGTVFVYAMAAIAVGVVRFWNAAGPVTGLSMRSLWQAMHDAGSLRYLDGGGMGCMNESERPEDRRKLYHHLTFYGFALCFASTASGTVFHYFGWEAPYPLWHPTVLLGLVGGLGLVVGPIGLLAAKSRRDGRIEARSSGMGTAFIWMLLLTSVTGLALLALRATPLMGLLLAVHLGVVFALFLSFPYGKFVHGFYRFAALVRHAHEQRAAGHVPAAKDLPKAA
ncbi:tricarballylate utilization 4Fe-4S protein TcuB [Microbaculum marinum]|uniref:Tricarballylate utilization 4Fe-4S protein TcuB n=1 Tax=Microbaculum marinum TaxID=1764581 RepID=A0AAW9RJR8_9HYPH